MKLSEVIPQFLSVKTVEEGCSSNTARAYQYDLEMFQHALNDLSVEMIRVLHIRNFLKLLYDKSYSKQGIGRKIACLRSFFQFCVDNDVIEKNPMNTIRSPKIRPEEALPKFLSEEEMTIIFNKLESHKGFTKAWLQRMHLIIRLMYASMARISELCSLKLSDVDLEHNLIKVRGKGNKERYIPVDPTTIYLLKDYSLNRRLETNDPSSPLFVNLRGNRLQPRSVERDLHAFKLVIGFSEDKKFTPHVFRHTGATHLRQNGMDLSELQDLLGHSSPNTTRIYAKNDMSRLKTSYLQYHPLAKRD